MRVTAFSNRYYPNELDKIQPDMWDMIVSTLKGLNAAKFGTYNAIYWHKFFKGQDCDPLKDATQYPPYEAARSFGYDSLYANSIWRSAKGVLDSQISNKKNYIKDENDAIESIQKKIDDTQESLRKKRAVKESIVHYAKTAKTTGVGEWATPYDKCTITIDGCGILTGFCIDPQDYRIYERKVEQDIRRLKARVGSLSDALLRHKRRKAKLETEPPKRAIFGSRALYKQKDTVGDTAEWKAAFHEARGRSFTVSGRGDSPFGNHLVRYDIETKDLVWKLPARDDGTVPMLKFPKVTFAQYGDALCEALKNDNIAKVSVGYTFEIRQDKKGKKFLIIKASFDTLEDVVPKISSFANGCIGIDINTDRIAISNIDRDGKQLSHGVIPMRLDGLSTGQARDTIGRAVRMVTQKCLDERKPLVMEDLDPKEMRKGIRYQNSIRNRKISQFAATEIDAVIRSQSVRYGYAVTKVDPKYTSFIGKILYMRPAGQSIHEAASYVIGLRGLGILPEPPKRLETLVSTEYPDYAQDDAMKQYYWRWSSLYHKCKEIPNYIFYNLMKEFKSKRDLTEWANEIKARRMNAITKERERQKAKNAEVKATKATTQGDISAMNAVPLTELPF